MPDYRGSDRGGSARVFSDGRRPPCESEKRADGWTIVYACDTVTIDCYIHEVEHMRHEMRLRSGIGNDDTYRERRAPASQTIGDPEPEEWNVETC